MAAHIEAMPLYTHLERIDRGLAALGIGPEDPIRPEQLFALDQWHYHGTDAISAAAKWLGLGPGIRVIEIGSGIGGPARYLAHTTGCHVTAIELQPGLNAIAENLTRRCGLGGLVSHVCGDALQVDLSPGAFDAAVSWLAVLHIPDRPKLFRRLANTLRSGAGCYIEDLCMRAPFAETDLRDLREVVYGITTTSIEDYAADLRSAGFVDVRTTDLSDDWAPFATERLAAWRQGASEYTRVHGAGAYSAQEKFYTVIDHLYRSGSLGGVRLSARMK